ncbi:MAG: PA0069 family radical SAM protein [Alphaproteobacteria bacterium]|nr:PA0069 family radical SAM protein [Alphaproteobacteria bacterium]
MIPKLPDRPPNQALADALVPDRPTKGRGAVSNRTGRYEAQERVAIADGWEQTPPPVAADDDDPPPSPRTTVSHDTTRTIIARNDSPDIPFDRSINPYRGCEHGCVYCFARPTHAYLGLSPGLDFETKLLMKPDAAKLLERELRNPRYRCDVMAMGTNTDPYQPVEREHRITRQILEVLNAFNHPVGIVTKSALVMRDIDILADMAKRNLASVGISVTSLDRDLARVMEPRASTPPRRLAAIAALAAAGIPTSVMVAPIIPALNDSEIERILAAAAAAGARSADYVLLRLPLEIKGLFEEWLEAHAPMKARRVLDLVRETRGGQLYEATFGKRMTGTGPYAQLVRNRFKLAGRKLGLDRRKLNLDVTRFRPPPGVGDQLSLGL